MNTLEKDRSSLGKDGKIRRYGLQEALCENKPDGTKRGTKTRVCLAALMTECFISG